MARILIDITHPAHLHFFRPAINIWKQRGHELILIARDKDLTLNLLNEYGYSHECLSKARKGVFGLLLELLEHEGKLLGIIKKTKPDVLLEIAGTFIVHAGVLTKTPSLVFYDTENATLSNAITYPFATKIITPACYKGDMGRKHIRYNGYQELAYTHPNHFSPSPAVLEELGINPEEKLFVVRFVAWEAGHDVNQSGFSLEGKRTLVKELSKYGRVIITSEKKLPIDLESFRMRISPTKIHDILAFSTLYIGESATMASESAILGTPFIYVSPVGRGYTEEQEERYALGYTLKPTEENRAIEIALRIGQQENLWSEWQLKRKVLLEEKIDVTSWMVDFIENYIEKG
jgi:uncharacterized protein